MNRAHKRGLGEHSSVKPQLEAVTVNVIVNGKPERLTVEPRMTLLDALREELGLTRTKKGCDRGECGACAVHVEGRRVLSCMILAAMQEGRRIGTIEGLEQNGITTCSTTPPSISTLF
jgi:xanthine dehydrogenase YagT iron-sulfur-binding subunit